MQAHKSLNVSTVSHKQLVRERRGCRTMVHRFQRSHCCIDTWFTSTDTDRQRRLLVALSRNCCTSQLLDIHKHILPHAHVCPPGNVTSACSSAHPACAQRIICSCRICPAAARCSITTGSTACWCLTPAPAGPSCQTSSEAWSGGCSACSMAEHRGAVRLLHIPSILLTAVTQAEVPQPCHVTPADRSGRVGCMAAAASMPGAARDVRMHAPTASSSIPCANSQQQKQQALWYASRPDRCRQQGGLTC